MPQAYKINWSEDQARVHWDSDPLSSICTYFDHSSQGFI